MLSFLVPGGGPAAWPELQSDWISFSIESAAFCLRNTGTITEVLLNILDQIFMSNINPLFLAGCKD